jgi:hypothetical protein
MVSVLKELIVHPGIWTNGMTMAVIEGAVRGAHRIVLNPALEKLKNIAQRK